MIWLFLLASLCSKAVNCVHTLSFCTWIPALSSDQERGKIPIKTFIYLKETSIWYCNLLDNLLESCNYESPGCIIRVLVTRFLFLSLRERILEFTVEIHIELWFSSLIMHPSQLGNLLEYRFLSPNTQNFCVRIQKVWNGTQSCTYKFPGNADVSDLGTTLWELLTSINDQ